MNDELRKPFFAETAKKATEISHFPFLIPRLWYYSIILTIILYFFPFINTKLKFVTIYNIKIIIAFNIFSLYNYLIHRKKRKTGFSRGGRGSGKALFAVKESMV